MEAYFNNFRKNIIGIEHAFSTFDGNKKIIYADWTASGRLYKPIEDIMNERFYPFVANTHSRDTLNGRRTTEAYEEAKKIIKTHCNAGPDDVLLTTGAGMTGAINKLQRLLGLKVHEKFDDAICYKKEDKPLVLVSHMEHHSNHTSWLVTLADVIVIKPDINGLIDIDDLEMQLILNKDRKVKIGAFSACSNVTGIKTNYHELARIMHKHNGLCFIDFAASAPYVEIDMHPQSDDMYLDGIVFSPHKFLGGPGSSGILIFNSKLYKNKIPDNTGGGTVKWTNAWNQFRFYDDIEIREDGGTPAFLQTIRAALAIRLKEKMGIKNIHDREEELTEFVFKKLNNIPNLHMLAGNITSRLPIFSFYIEDIHHNIIVKALNDYFGIQTRGGCSCCGTYGHYLLGVDFKKSQMITEQIDMGNNIEKPGWIRASLHPTTTNDEAAYICSSVKTIVADIEKYRREYSYHQETDSFIHNKHGDVPVGENLFSI